MDEFKFDYDPIEKNNNSNNNNNFYSLIIFLLIIIFISSIIIYFVLKENKRKQITNKIQTNKIQTIKEGEKKASGIIAAKKDKTKTKTKEKCNYKYHCLNKCKKSKGKLWCYLNKKSKNICRIDGNNKGPYAKKSGSKWSYQPCKNFVDKSIKKNKKKHTLRSCKCKIPWPCYDSKTKQCFGSGNQKDYPNNDVVIKYCNNVNLNACIDNKTLKKNNNSNCKKCRNKKCTQCISRWGYCGNTFNHCNKGIDCKKC
jgi:hypothetical protein